MKKNEDKNMFGIIAAGYFGAVILFSVCLGDALATQTFAVVLTGAILIWYTIETQLLRKETQKQTELQIRPFVIMEFKNNEFYLKNIGRGPALNIKIKPVQVSSEESIVIKFEEMISIVNAGDQIQVEPEGFRNGRSTEKFFTAHLKPQYANRNLSIFIDYHSINLEAYTTRERVSPKKWEIVELTK